MAQPVEREALLSDAQQAVLGEALNVIGQLHARGLWQADLHLDNLLRHGGRLLVIDGGGVQAEQAGQPLSRQRVLENLGVFFAQLPKRLEPFIEELLVHYLLGHAQQRSATGTVKAVKPAVPSRRKVQSKPA